MLELTHVPLFSRVCVVVFLWTWVSRGYSLVSKLISFSILWAFEHQLKVVRVVDFKGLTFTRQNLSASLACGCVWPMSFSRCLFVRSPPPCTHGSIQAIEQKICFTSESASKMNLEPWALSHEPWIIYHVSSVQYFLLNAIHVYSRFLAAVLLEKGNIFRSTVPHLHFLENVCLLDWAPDWLRSR